MSIVVYYLSDSTPQCVILGDHQMSEGLSKCQELRAAGFTHVTMVSQPDGQVGTSDRGGAVFEGKLPSGEDYAWSKAHRAGAKQQKEIFRK